MPILTDMMKAKDGNFFISNWLRNRNTVEYLDVWECIYNPDFNYGEFAIIKSKAGLNNYKISIKEWTERTNSINYDSLANVSDESCIYIKIDQNCSDEKVNNTRDNDNNSEDTNASENGDNSAVGIISVGIIGAVVYSLKKQK